MLTTIQKEGLQLLNNHEDPGLVACVKELMLVESSQSKPSGCGFCRSRDLTTRQYLLTVGGGLALHGRNNNE